ncbi:MAG: acyl-CoA desaturase [Brumimicrobium sp.]
MITKTVIMLISFLVPTILLNFGVISSPLVTILLYVICGFAMAGIGMGVMHDANHGAYTKNKFFNYILSHTLDFVGISSDLWKIQHNMLHHTYTNVHGHDEDIDAPAFLLRFSPESKSYKIQRYQHLYVWGFYSLLTLWWITAKDFIKVRDYYKSGLIKTKKERRVLTLKFIPMKLFYFTYALVIPMIMAPFSPLWILLGFIISHLIVGLMLSIVFQLAHVVPETEFLKSNEEGELENNWFTHQLRTTSNFSPKNKFLIWYFGGLTHQIEHHLFPGICHVHYPSLSKIVSKTAKEFKLPYYVNTTFFEAIAGHTRTLKKLGRMTN